MNPLLIRRRGMMVARGTSIKQRLIDMGCIMWFPLDLDNGLNDVIGGKLIDIVIPNSLVYDTNVNMYYVHLSTALTTVAKIDVSYTSADFNGGWSTVTQVRRYSVASSRGTSSLLRTNNGTVVQNNLLFMCINENGSSWTPQWTNDLVNTAAYVCSDNGRTIYHDASLIVSDNVNYQHPWGCTEFDITAYNGSAVNRYAYLKNLMLFNRQLTASEVAEIQSMIN